MPAKSLGPFGCCEKSPFFCDECTSKDNLFLTVNNGTPKLMTYYAGDSSCSWMVYSGRNGDFWFYRGVTFGDGEWMSFLQVRYGAASPGPVVYLCESPVEDSGCPDTWGGFTFTMCDDSPFPENEEWEVTIGWP